jgi:transcriptional repressor NrdR
VYRSFEDVADFRDEIEKLERDHPTDEGQLPLLEVADAPDGKAAKPVRR